MLGTQGLAIYALGGFHGILQSMSMAQWLLMVTLGAKLNNTLYRSSMNMLSKVYCLGLTPIVLYIYLNDAKRYVDQVLPLTRACN